MRATFHMDGKNYTFDNRGDLNSGYDVILWKQTSTHVDVHDIVAHYSIENQELNFTSQKTLHSVIVRICLPLMSYFTLLSFIYHSCISILCILILYSPR